MFTLRMLEGRCLMQCLSIQVNAGSVAADKVVNLLANFLVARLVNGKSSEQNKAAY